ncbi:MAG: hypothetical protein Q9184_001885 [Pyrenodesmia sp. 2 TL-2023]
MATQFVNTSPPAATGSDLPPRAGPSIHLSIQRTSAPIQDTLFLPVGHKSYGNLGDWDSEDELSCTSTDGGSFDGLPLFDDLPPAPWDDSTEARLGLGRKRKWSPFSTEYDGSDSLSADSSEEPTAARKKPKNSPLIQITPLNLPGLRHGSRVNGHAQVCVQLDNFLGCGPYQPMDASHLCHQDHCIVHVTYEAADINQDRKLCAERARNARKEGADIPRSCSRHSPPCLLQHAALTTCEVYLIQFDILRRATGLPLSLAAPENGHHPYPTLESRLPLTWKMSEQALSFDTTDLVAHAPPIQRPDQPDLVCPYCARLKAWATPTGFWGHLFHKHAEIDPAQRLQEIRRTAGLWADYWQQGPDGGKHGPTMDKLGAAQKDSFSWEDVVAWQLR